MAGTSDLFMNPTVSIILVTYNSAPHLAACLAALRALRYDPAPEIVIVDNASQDESPALVRELLPQARLLPQTRNLGFAGGVHQGVAASSGEYVVLLNPDTIVEPGWLAPLIAALADPACGIAGSKILDVDGRMLLHTGGVIDAPLMLADHSGNGEVDRGQYEQSTTVSFVTGAALALRRELWDRLGGLDRGFFPGYFEDVDLCWRAQALGLECRYVPQSVLQHRESSSSGKFSGRVYYYYHRNRLRFACKHLPWPELWGEFAPAEARRLGRAGPLDRAVAGLVYRQALPHGLAEPDAAEQAGILATGQLLAAVAAEQEALPEQWPAAIRELLGLANGTPPALADLLAEVEREAVLREHRFRSRLPWLAGLRAAWNSVATRWYVLPVLEQQTRFNLAAQRSLWRLQEEMQTQPALLETQVRQALLCYRLATKAKQGPCG
jgi:GT2 family glycosyltransferase